MEEVVNEIAEEEREVDGEAMMEEAGKLIDLPITEFIAVCCEKTYLELGDLQYTLAVGTIPALHHTRALMKGLVQSGALQITTEMLKERTADEINEQFGKDKQIAFDNYISTYVVEKLILERIDVLNKLRSVGPMGRTAILEGLNQSE